MTEMSVRQWQERFRAGDFNSRDLSVQCEAGWFDWFCRNDALAGRLKKLSSAVLGIKAPFILDNYYVWFKNNCPMAGPLYDDVRFEPLSGEREGKYFVITLDCPHELAKWVLYTERYGYDAPEFCSGNVRDMGQYITAWPPNWNKASSPPFFWRSGRSASISFAMRENTAFPSIGTENTNSATSPGKTVSCGR